MSYIVCADASVRVIGAAMVNQKNANTENAITDLAESCKSHAELVTHDKGGQLLIKNEKFLKAVIIVHMV